MPKFVNSAPSLARRANPMHSAHHLNPAIAALSSALRIVPTSPMHNLDQVFSDTRLSSRCDNHRVCVQHPRHEGHNLFQRIPMFPFLPSFLL